MAWKDEKIAHTRERLLVRWGIDYSPEQIEEVINRRIQAGESTPLGKTSNSRTVHELEIERENPMTFEKETVKIVFYYDKYRNTVTTALGPNMEPVIVHPYDP